MDSTTQATLERIQLLRKAKDLIGEREDCELSLRKFVKAAWPVVEPGVPFVHGYHIDAICDHFEAVIAGDIKKLIINISPRSSKSTLGCIMLPAWVWIRYPEKKFLFSSYDLKLSMRDSRKCNTLIKSAWYQKAWADRFKILVNKGGQDTKQRFDNDHAGHRIATSTDAGTIGEGGDMLYYDDPNDIGQMNSDAYIEKVIYFHDHIMASRLNDPKTGARICVQQRSGERDMTGHILSKEQGWDHLVIRMEFEGPSKTTSIGWHDWRTKPGELMWPERLGPDEIREFKKTEIVWSGQYQQRPAPAEGNRFKRHWWNYWNAEEVTEKTPKVMVRAPGTETIGKAAKQLPIAFEQVIHSWDLSFKGGDKNDYVVGQVWGRLGADFYLIDQLRERLDFPATVKAFRSFVARYPATEKLVEDKANGPAVIATLKNEIPGIIAIIPDGGKEARANAVAPYVESGNVYLPNPERYPWVNQYIEEFAAFPNARFDDSVDSTSQGIRRLADSVINTCVPEFRVMPRPGEPQTACHVEDDRALLASIPSHWRRWISVAPGPIGAALWMCETPSGALRVYRELALEGLDAFEVGRRIAEQTLPDIKAFASSVQASAKWHMDVLLEKVAFVPVENIGSYAELLESGLYGFDPLSGTWDSRQEEKAILKQAKFSAQVSELEDAAWDRLRDLLRFKPPDYEELPYSRAKAFALAARSINEYSNYMAAVEGRIPGEFPKLKFGASCVFTVASLGAARRFEDVSNPFLRALLIGITAPPSVLTKSNKVKEIPWSANTFRYGAMQRIARRLVG